MRDIRRNFSGGEITPQLLGRNELARYQSSCHIMKNFIAQLHGGARFRSGFAFLDEALGDGAFIPFEFNTDEEDIYVLVFTDQKLRIIQDDGYVLDGGSPVEINTPYLVSDLPGLVVGFVQTGDVIYLAHRDYTFRKLTRSSHTEWALEEIDFEIDATPPENVEARWAGQADGEFRINYKVTAVSDTGYESLPVKHTVSDGFQSGDWVEGDSVTIQWWWDDPNWEPLGFYVYKEYVGYYGVIGYYEREQNRVSLVNENFKWTLYSGNEYYLVTADGSDPFGKYGVLQAYPGYNAQIGIGPFVLMDRGSELTYGTAGSLSAGEWGILWHDVDEFHTFHVRLADGVDPDTLDADSVISDYFGAFIVDENFIPDMTQAPPIEYNPFEDDNNPGVATIYQQRLWLGGSNQYPASFYASRTGDFENFGRSEPTRDDDSLELTLATGKVAKIEWMAPAKGLVIGTAGAEINVTGGDYTSITPSNVNAEPLSHWGSRAEVQPIFVGNSIIHIQRQSGKVRDLFYSLERAGYAGNDLSVLAEHLFNRHMITSWAYQQEPGSVVWAVRDDGVLLALTYLKEHDIWGWSWHTTDGKFKRVCAVGGDTEDRVYVLVEREIGGSSKYYVEKLHTQWAASDGIENAFYVDSGLKYDGWNSTETYLKTITGGSNWEAGESVTLSASGHTPFSASSVGDRYKLKSGDETVYAIVTGYVSSSQVTADLMSDVPASLQSSATYEWSLLATTISGLDHLEGESVVALADGEPVSGLVVTGGSVSFSNAISKAIIGLPYTGVLSPLTFEFETEVGTTQGYPRGFGQTRIKLFESVGGKIGGGPVDAEIEALDLEPIPYSWDVWGAAVPPFTGVKAINPTGGVEDDLTLYMVQDQPLPFNVHFIVADVDFGQ